LTHIGASFHLKNGILKRGFPPFLTLSTVNNMFDMMGCHNNCSKKTKNKNKEQIAIDVKDAGNTLLPGDAELCVYFGL
jgi:hypothetical protein